MEKIISLLCGLAMSAAADTMKTDTAEWRIDPVTGAVSEVRRFTPDAGVVRSVCNHYFLLSKSGDSEALESGDKVVARSEKESVLEFQCVNPRLKGIRIVKRYRNDGAYFRREVKFYNDGKEKVFLTLRTRIGFDNGFFRDTFYLGSGYIGPLIAAPRPGEPMKEVRYKQSSKGMAAYHSDGRGSFAHYRTRLNGRFVFPWWQSAIPSYLEKENYLYYMPDGWEMSLGTFDIPAGNSFSAEDSLVFFPGGWYDFLNKVYPQDPVVAGTLKTLQEGPEWLKNVKVYVGYDGKQKLLQMLELVEDGDIMVLVDVLGNWGDYRVWNGMNGQMGGKISGPEMKRFIAELKALSPRIRVGIYNWINSVGITSPVWKQHPEMFMKKNRAGQDKNLFPGGFILNYPTMINRPAAAKFMHDMFAGIIDYLNVDYIYLDETKSTNLIDWERNDIVRDDHWYDFWAGMKQLGTEKNVVMFGNGRGNPYFDLNFIEAAHQLAPQYWREFVGMAMAPANFVTHRAGARLCLLYWNPNLDYINRVLANGFIPAIHTLRYQQIPFLTANAEIGKSSIVDLKYTPDWKSDSKTDLETYCIRRDSGGEIIFSAINRAAQVRNAVVEMEIPEKGRNIQVWEYRIDRYDDKSPSRYVLGEKDIRRNYRHYRWREGLVTTPVLIYQGINPGRLKHTFTNFAPGELRQIVISRSPAGVYSVNAMPANYFFTRVPHVRISHWTFPIRVESDAETAEIILFGKTGTITVNGQETTLRYAQFGNRYYPLVTVPRGIFEIDSRGNRELKTEPYQVRMENGQFKIDGSPGLVTVKRNGKLLYCGSSPVLPEHHDMGELVFNTVNGKLKVPAGKPTAAMLVARPPQKPPYQKTETLNRDLDGAKILSGTAWTAPWCNQYGLQESLAPAVAAADGEKLCLEAGTTPKITDFLTHACAGFLLSGAEKIQVRLAHTFDSDSGIFHGHLYPYARNPFEFAGLFLDYQRPGGFSRIAFSAGIASPNGMPGLHPWGSSTSAVQLWELGNLVDRPSPAVFTLDLKRYAPKDWTGKVWLSVGTSWVKPDRRLRLTLEHCNHEATAPVVDPVDRAAIRKEFLKPKMLRLPVLRDISFETLFRKGARIEKLFLLGNVGYPVFQSSAALGCDADSLYVAVRMEEENPDTENQLEIWFKPENDGTIQIMIDRQGEYEVNRNGLRTNDIPVRVRRVQPCAFLVSVPRSLFGKAGSVKFNLCRDRQVTKQHAQELSTWAPLFRSFLESANFGTLLFENCARSVSMPVRVFNYGKPGYTTGEYLGQPLQSALQLNPSLALVMIGTNDMINSAKLTDYPVFEKNLIQIINRIRGTGADLILATIPPCSEKLLFLRHKPAAFRSETPSDRILRANQIIRRIAAEQNLPLVDLYALVSRQGDPDSAESFLRNMANVKSPDGVHLTAKGTAAFATEIAKTIRIHKFNTARIVCIGDSNTYGANLKGAGTVEQETYPAALLRELGR